MRITTEFPQYDISTLPALPSTWVDVSWHNDSCPSWQAGSVFVYISEENPDDREVVGGERYWVCDDHGTTLLSTDDWSEVLNFVRLNNLDLPEIVEGSTDALTKTYDKFLAVTGLPAMSADELILQTEGKINQWLAQFIEDWERAQAEEDAEWDAYAAQKTGINK